MEEARKAPKTVMREFQAMARGLVEEVDAQVDKIRKSALTGDGEARFPRHGGGRQSALPRPVIRGKVPQENPRSKGGKGHEPSPEDHG